MNFSQLLDPSSVPRDDADLALFQRELADVQPLAQDHVRSARRAGDSESLRARRAAAEQETDLDSDFLQMEAVTLCDPHDPVEFRRDGVQEGVYRKLRLGEYPLHASLDLQGQTLRQAKQSLVAFLHECRRLELRSVLIRHGRGERSNPPAVLKSYVSQWLQQWPEVLALHSALPAFGGTGAVYVLLRKSDRQKMETRERIWRHMP